MGSSQGYWGFDPWPKRVRDVLKASLVSTNVTCLRSAADPKRTGAFPRKEKEKTSFLRGSSQMGSSGYVLWDLTDITLDG